MMEYLVRCSISGNYMTQGLGRLRRLVRRLERDYGGLITIISYCNGKEVHRT